MKGNIGHSIAANRASTLHKKHHMKSEEAVQLTKRLLFDEIARTHGTDINVLQKLNMGEIWRKFVKNRNDAEAFLEVMYPQFPKQV